MTDSAVLAELARFGPSFALATHQPGFDQAGSDQAGSPAAGPVPAAGWRPLQDLLQPGPLQAQVAAVRAALAQASGRQPAEVEPRVAASLAQLGLAARLVCPALGLAALTGRLLRMDPALLRWQPGSGGAVALSAPADAFEPLEAAPASHTANSAALADALARTVLDGPVRALVEVAEQQFQVSPQILWGNVASVVNGARTLIGAAEPAVAARADEIVRGLLDRAPLTGAHQGSAPAGFRRRSCCLLYRLDPARTPVCGDCVLLD